VINASPETAFAVQLATDLFGADATALIAHPEAMTEDFSRFGARIPAFFAFLGACPAGVDWRTAASNHSSEAVFDDAALQRGIDFEVAWALGRLDSPPGKN
jgi:hippurate hydrolase